MKKIYTQIFIISIALTLWLSIFTGFTLAKYASESNIPLSINVNGDYRVSEFNNTVTITKYIGNGGDVSIPSTLNGKVVTTIGANSFEGNLSVTGISIPNTVKTIGPYAFSSCANISGALNIPNSVNTIGTYAFFNCNKIRRSPYSFKHTCYSWFICFF